MRIVAASDYAELEAEVSGTVVNRITFDGDRIAQVSRAPGGLAGRAGEKSNLRTRRTRQGQVLLFSGLAAVGLRSNADDIGERITVGILPARVELRSDLVYELS